MNLPTTTKSWVYQREIGLEEPLSDCLQLTERPIPPLQNSQVLIRVDAAPVNPSDEMYLRRQYGVLPKVGDVPGFEGCGTVIAAKGGPYAWWLNGRRVSFGGQDGNGTWSQYVTMGLYECIPISKSLPIEAAATLIVNPMTALGMFARIKKYRAKAFVMNAAGSAVGRYMLALADRQGVEFIGIVRRQETADDLRRAGAKHVLVSIEPNFMEHFDSICDKLSPTVFLDAVAGHDSADLFKTMPDQSVSIVYGQLSQEALAEGRVAYDPDDLVFRKKRIEGYWLTDELHSAITPLSRAAKISKFFKSGVFKVPPVQRCSLETLLETIQSGRGKALYVRE